MNEQGLFYRDTWAEVDLDCTFAECDSFKKLCPGSGYYRRRQSKCLRTWRCTIAETALEAGATYLAVAFMDEAIALRNKGITAPILVLGATRPEDVNTAAKYRRLPLTVFQLEWMEGSKKII